LTNRLLVLVGDFDGTESECAERLSEWSAAGLLSNVAWIDLPEGPLTRPQAVLSRGKELQQLDLYELLTSQVWNQITVGALRQPDLVSLAPARFTTELAILDLISSAFGAYSELDFSSMTVSMGSDAGLVQEAFSPLWKSHLLQEPVVRTDKAVAAQPLWDDYRHLLILFLALTAGGGLIWQTGSLVGKINDPVVGSFRPVRVARAYVRVLTAGRLTDEILAGAFPASGPWSVPPDLVNSQAVPPGTPVLPQTLDDLIRAGEFEFGHFAPRQRKRRKRIGIFGGLKLFVSEFFRAVASVPSQMIAVIKEEVAEFVTSITYGPDSSVLLSFDPKSADLDSTDAVRAIRGLRIGANLDPVSDARRWELLQKVSLGCIDGTQFPEEISEPRVSTTRLVYVDPSSIGPATSEPDFVLSSFEKALLGLEEESPSIGSMDIEGVTRLQICLAELKRSFGPYGPQSSEPAWNVEQPIRGKRRRRRRKLEANRSAAAAALGSPLQTSVESARHRPSHPEFDVTQYEVISAFYQGQNKEILAEYEQANKISRAVTTEHTAADGFWKSSKGCDHCGTPFEHGMLLLHQPSGETIHVGHICARRYFQVSEQLDFLRRRVLEIDSRLAKWIALRSDSLLWRVGSSIVNGLVTARTNFANSLEYLKSQASAPPAEQRAQKRFGKWTRRGGLFFLLLIAASAASVIFTALPILLFAAILTAYFAALMIRLFFLARDIVRAKYRMQDFETQADLVMERSQFEAGEIVRLASIREQFEDWQRIIREVIHLPFGREVGFSSGKSEIKEVVRPPAMILGSTQPDDAQKMKLFTNARRQTVHVGWLTEIMDILKMEWRKDYELARLTGSADNIQPEADTAPSGSVVGKRPLSDQNVYYPRTEFCHQVVAGNLQRHVVTRKAEQVAEDLRRDDISQLLGPVEVSGLGAALNGLPVSKFLSGLFDKELEPTMFPPDLVSDQYPSYRIFGPELELPERDKFENFGSQYQVHPGVELTVAAWKVELSRPIQPLDVLRGFQPAPDRSGEETDTGQRSEDSVV
jgi:hypothetical protein